MKMLIANLANYVMAATTASTQASVTPFEVDRTDLMNSFAGGRCFFRPWLCIPRGDIARRA
ncbi:MAG: hypothetical protein FWB78_01050, partial [Treponema sp.]|nr:hypothetical protein [Treponema sp.]